MRTLIYTSIKTQSGAETLAETLKSPKDTVGIRVFEFWAGEVEKCDQVITDNEQVANAYKQVGTKVSGFPKTNEPKTDVSSWDTHVEVDTQVQTPVKRMGRPSKVRVEEELNG